MLISFDGPLSGTAARPRETRPVWHRLVSATICLFAVTGCSEGQREAAPRENSPRRVLRMATTTSTRDSGLLDVLLPVFQDAYGCRVDVVAAGTGAALKLGEEGDVDVLLVHARAAEERFMEAGHGIRREEFMYNDFLLLGPEEDPAQIGGLEPVRAMARIAAGGHRFLSRGDESGTHQREMALWDEAVGRRLDWEEYLEGGQGMGPTLVMADEKRAYLLADRGTYLNFRDKVTLVPLAAAAESLRNPYAAIVVNSPERATDGDLANRFVEFLISEKGQRLIAHYQIAGQRLFHPTRFNSET